jgi:hypothetical protein
VESKDNHSSLRSQSKEGSGSGDENKMASKLNSPVLVEKEQPLEENKENK